MMNNLEQTGNALANTRTISNSYICSNLDVCLLSPTSPNFLAPSSSSYCPSQEILGWRVPGPDVCLPSSTSPSSSSWLSFSRSQANVFQIWVSACHHLPHHPHPCHTLCLDPPLLVNNKYSSLFLKLTKIHFFVMLNLQARMAINVLCVCWRIRRKGPFRTLCIHRLSCWSAFAFELSCQRTPLPPCICKCLVKMPQNLKKSKVWCGFVSVCTISLLNASIISVGRLAPVLWKCFCKSDLREHFQRNKMIPKSHIEDYKPTITSSNIHENKKKNKISVSRSIFSFLMRRKDDLVVQADIICLLYDDGWPCLTSRQTCKGQVVQYIKPGSVFGINRSIDWFLKILLTVEFRWFYHTHNSFIVKSSG